MVMNRLKSLKEMLELDDDSRLSYFRKNLDALNETLSSREVQSILSSLYDRLIYENDFSGIKLNDTNLYEDAGRRFWFLNHASILSGIDKIIMGNGQLPDVKDLQDYTKLNETAIQKHLKDFEHTEYMELDRKKLRISAYSYIVFLTKIAYNGNLKAGEMLLKFINDYSQDNSGNKIRNRNKINIKGF